MLAKTSPIALDFGEHAVKVLQVERRGERLRIRDARCCEVRAGSDAGEGRRERWVAAARRALKAGSFRGRDAIGTLRLADITTRHIRVPATELERAGEFLSNEIRDQPGSLTGDISLCSIPVADLVDHGVSKREYLCCIADSTVVNERIELIEQLGLMPVAMDLETCAQVRPFLYHAADASFLHVDLGCHCTRITIVKSGIPVLMRTVPMGGSEMEATLQHKLELDVDAVLDLAAEGDDRESLEASVTRALADQLDLVLGRMADCVHYCASMFQGRSVSRLRVAGSISSLPGVVPYLGRRFGIKAELADPVAALELPELGDQWRLSPGTYGTALGLAMRGVAA